MVKNAAALKLVENITKDFGEKSVYMARDMPPIPYVSSGSLCLDFAIGTGGIPTNRMVELCGSEGSGKTTLALLTACSIIDRDPNRMVMYIDMEHKLTPEWMEKLIEDRMDNLFIFAPDSIEQAHQAYRKYVKQGIVSMAIIDSLGGAPTNQAMDDTRNVAEKAMSMGGNAKAVSELSRLACNLSAKYDCLTLGINQTRDDTKSMHGNQIQTPSGHAWKHHCALRIHLRRGYEKLEVKRGGEAVQVGFDISARILKNQLGGTENRTAKWQFFTKDTEEFGPFGIDTTEECVRLSTVLGVVERGGSYYKHSSFPGGQIQGKPAMFDLVREDSKVREALVADVMAMLSKEPDKIAEVAPIETED